MDQKFLIGMLALTFGVLTGLTRAQIPYPSTHDFETDPFAGDWSRVIGDGTAEWSTAQAASGSRSIRMVATGSAPWGEDPRVFADLSNVPQTGIVQVQFKVYTVGTGSNFVSIAHFGANTTQLDGLASHQIMSVAFGPGGGNSLQVHDARSWVPQASANVDHLNKWVTHRLLFDQDNLTYDYFIDLGDGEQLMVVGGPTRGTKLGDPSFPYYTSQPFARDTEYFFDDFEIGPAVGPTPTPTPTPVPLTPLAFPLLNDFETDPFAANHWRAEGDTVEWSMDEAASGSRSIHLLNVDPGIDEDPRVFADLTNAPQTGVVQVQFKIYLLGVGGNFVMIGHFGANTTQQGGLNSYQIMSVAFGPGGGNNLHVHDANSWNDTGIPNADHLEVWVTHRLLFDQDNLTYDYFVDLGGGEMQVMNDAPTRGTRVGDPASPFFTSQPFPEGTNYYLDDFQISLEGDVPTPTPTPTPVNSVEYWFIY